jgi:peptidoglycan/LPS O-acetylase OafA/YrhL
MSKRLTYLPKLDALRAIAALMVLFVHYLQFKNVFSYGGNGVQIFFVISGFLITGILLAQKNDSIYPKSKLIGSFIIKRALRLFPVYFLFLLFLYALSLKGGLWLGEKSDMWHYFTYTQNFLFMKKVVPSPLLFHTWSLAVEEQFYLIWPFIIFLIPRKAELPVLLFVFFSGILAKIYFLNFFPCEGTIKGLTLIHFDTLGAGALLAYCIHYEKTKFLSFWDRFGDLIFGIGFVSSVSLTAAGVNDSFFLPLSITIMASALVYICAHKKKSILDPLLNIRALASIGKISYGLYLFHKPVPFFFTYLYSKTGLAPIHNWIVLLIIYLTIALMIAALSFRFIEKPILKLKEKFDL